LEGFRVFEVVLLMKKREKLKNETKKMKKIFLILIGMIFLVSAITFVSASLNVTLSDQGTNVRLISDGSALLSGNITIQVWDSIVAGDIIYNETFTNGIINGSWNVMIGENYSNPLSLEYGRVYYKEYRINDEDVDFKDYAGATVERKAFYSPLGDIGGEDISEEANLTIANLNVDTNLIYTLNNKIGFKTSEISADHDFDFNGDVRIQGELDVVGNFTSLNVQNLFINGSLLPEQDSMFNIGNSTSRFSDASFSGYVNVDTDVLVDGKSVCLDDGTNCVLGTTITNNEITDGTITDADISDTTDLTLGEKITFTFLETIDNIVNGWIRITGNLKVVGDANITGDTISTSFLATDGTVDDPAFSFISDTDTGIYRVPGTTASDGLFFSVNGDEKLQIRSSSTAPGLNILSGSLYIGGTRRIMSSGDFRAPAGTSSAPSFSFASDSNTGFSSLTPDNLSIITGGVERMRIDSSGKVGIGTESPDYKLDVSGTVKATAFVGDGSQLTGIGGLWTNSSGDATFITGNVGIGTTEPSTKLEISTNEIINGIRINSLYSQLVLAKDGMDLADFRVSDGGLAGGLLNIRTKSPEDPEIYTRMSIGYNGNVGIGTTNPNAKLDVSGTVKATAFVGDGSGLTGISGGGGWTNTPTTTTTSLNVGIGGTIDFGYELIHTVCEDTKSCLAVCPAGKKIMGGGCGNSGNFAITQNYPNDVDEWECVITSTSSHVEAYAFCARID